MGVIFEIKILYCIHFFLTLYLKQRTMGKWENFVSGSDTFTSRIILKFLKVMNNFHFFKMCCSKSLTKITSYVSHVKLFLLIYHLKHKCILKCAYYDYF